MRILTTLVIGLSLALGLALPALAVDLKSTDITQDGKRVTLHLRFSAPVEYELIAHYAKNQLILHVTGLKLSKQQLKSGIAIKGNLAEAVNGAALDQPKDQPYGEIRLQLQKGFNPGDAQVIPRESVIDIQFVVSQGVEAKPAAGGKPATEAKPAAGAAAASDEEATGWQPPAAADEPLTTLTGQRFDAPLTIGAATGDAEDAVLITDDEPAADTGDEAPLDEPAADPAADPGVGAAPAPDENGFIPEAETEIEVDTAESGESAKPEALEKPFTTEELAAFSGMMAADNGDSEDVVGLPEDEPAQPEADGASAARELEPVEDDMIEPAEDDEPAAVESAPAEAREPAATPPAFTPGPSYRQVDLGSVAVNQREYRNLPFREAILDLVAGTGFNVVVGPDIDNETVYLNFKQQELSLKSALETLCTVYELAYSVSDDVISITRQ